MNQVLDQEELRLRRKLLFRILKNFDFDKPRLQYEAISAPVANFLWLESVDEFVFRAPL